MEISAQPQRIVELMHKFVYLANQYEKKNLSDLTLLFQVPSLDMNAAIWLAQDLGYVSIEGKQVTVENIPSQWNFGDNSKTLMGTILYVIQRLNREEGDLEETKIATWCQGFPAHDYVLALNYLVNEKIVAEYRLKDLKDKKSIYTYYTLPCNLSEEWGKKQFKNQKKVERVL